MRFALLRQFVIGPQGPPFCPCACAKASCPSEVRRMLGDSVHVRSMVRARRGKRTPCGLLNRKTGTGSNPLGGYGIPGLCCDEMILS